MKASVLQVIFYTWAAASLSFSCHSYFPKSSGHIPVFLLRCQYHNAHISKTKRPASHAISDEVWVRGQDFVCCIIWDSQQKVGSVHHNAHAHHTKLEIPGNQLKIPPTWDFIHGSFLHIPPSLYLIQACQDCSPSLLSLLSQCILCL